MEQLLFQFQEEHFRTENWYGFNPTALTAGTYVYTVNDTNNCSITDSVTITQSQDSLTSTLMHQI